MDDAYGALDPVYLEDESAAVVPMIYTDPSQRYGMKWKVGDVTITRIVETESASDLSYLVPGATRDRLKELEWLQPHFVTKHGLARTSIHALVVETPSRRIVVDTCLGNDKQFSAMPDFSNWQTPFLNDMVAAGFAPETIDVVLCTHLHMDHVGWNTMRVDGQWVPTFPQARYLYSRTEYDYWTKGTDLTTMGWDVTQRETFAESVKPIYDAGLVDFIDPPMQLCDEVRLVLTPGHSPGHISVQIDSQGERAVITGDVLHHPCQMAHPEWGAFNDYDSAQAEATRRELFQEVAGQPVLVIGTHFGGPTAGYVHRDGDGYRLKVDGQ